MSGATDQISVCAWYESIRIHVCNTLIAKQLYLTTFFALRAEIEAATVLQQILAQAAGSCLPGAIDQIIMDTKVILVRCLEIGMAGKLHHIVFPHALLEPVTDGSSPEIMELTIFNVCPSQNLAKTWTEVVDHL